MSEIVNPTLPLAIGNAISGGTSKSILFVDSNGNVAQDNTNLNFDTSTGKMGLGALNTSSAKMLITGNSNPTLIGVLDTGQNVTTQMASYATAGGFGVFGTTSNHPFILQSNTTSRMAILTNGNVGINTTGPNGQFEIMNGVSGASYVVAVTNSATGDYFSIQGNGNTTFGAKTVINSSGVVTKYNNISTAGNGIGSIVYTISATGLTSNQSITMFTPAVSGLYRANIYTTITTANTSGTLHSVIGWTDDGGAKTASPADISTGALNNQMATYYFRSTATAITATLTLSSLVGGNPTYAAFLTLEAL